MFSSSVQKINRNLVLHTPVVLVAVIFSILLSVFYHSYFVEAAAGDNVTGYAWSDNIGWISMNSTNHSGTTDYGVTIDQVTGAFSGYAWSDNIGWISFNASQLSNCPLGSCAPIVDWSAGSLSGWARACAGTATGNCSTSASRTDGWDGWIQLDGVTVDKTTGVFSGYAWGSDVVGWVDFSGVLATNPPVPANLTAGSVAFGSFTIGQSVTLSSLINNEAGTSDVTVSFNNLFQLADDTSGTNKQDIGWSTVNSLVSGDSQNVSVTYTFTAPGTYFVRACADKSTSDADNGVIDEGSNEGDNCSAWRSITASCGTGNFWYPVTNTCVLLPTISLEVEPGTIRAGNTADVNINTTSIYVLTCTMYGANSSPTNLAFNPTNGKFTPTVPITTRTLSSTQTLLLSCTINGTSETITTEGRVEVIGNAQEL